MDHYCDDLPCFIKPVVGCSDELSIQTVKAGLKVVAHAGYAAKQYEKGPLNERTRRPSKQTRDV